MKITNLIKIEELRYEMAKYGDSLARENKRNNDKSDVDIKKYAILTLKDYNFFTDEQIETLLSDKLISDNMKDAFVKTYNATNSLLNK